MPITYVEPGTYLFRFLNPNSSHFWSAVTDILAEQNIFLSSRTQFNDPHDSNPEIEDDLSSSIIKAYAREMLANPWRPDRDPDDIVRILRLQAEGKTRLNKQQIANIKLRAHQSTKEFLDECGLTSFSLTKDHPLLWGHYAAGYSGVCIVFRRGTSMQSGLCLCAKVHYVDALPKLPLSLHYRLVRAQRASKEYDELADRILSLSFLHKFKHWEYEQEARIFHPSRASSKLSFEKSELVGIILGPKSSRSLEEKLAAEISRLALTVRLARASLSATDYKIAVPGMLETQES